MTADARIDQLRKMRREALRGGGPERIAALLPEDRLTIAIEPEDQTTRSFTIAATGPRAATALKALEQELG